MQMLFDFFPIIVFFVVFKLFGIYPATAAAIIISIIQNFTYYFKHKKIENMRFITLIIVFVLGGATLAFHNILFIKWKPTVVYWIFALVFLGSHFLNKKPLFRVAMESKVTLPDAVWRKLNYSWGLFFLIVGGANLYVAYHYSTNVWVNFKLFGILGLMVLFVILQAIFLAKHVSEELPR
jgi:intracellular septation protein